MRWRFFVGPELSIMFKQTHEMTKGVHPTHAITNRITAGLTQIERARGFLEAATLSETWIREMGRRALILEAHHTTHIEGTRLTLEQAEQLLAGKPVPEADPDDVRELLCYHRLRMDPLVDEMRTHLSAFK